MKTLRHWLVDRLHRAVVIYCWKSAWDWGICPCRHQSAVWCRPCCRCQRGSTVSTWSASTDPRLLSGPPTDTAAPVHIT